LVPDGCGLVLPNAFSPNGDGLNDIFRIKYPFAVKVFRLAVYNRLGEKIFETSDMAQGWDGTFKGIKQPMGVYIWIIQLTSLNNIKQTVKGTVTLLK
jgi:gliding motility-associated-like protein